MKKLLLILAISLFGFISLGVPTSVHAKVRVHGYYKKSGKYVAPYFRTNRNKTKLDNWSHKGNINPYTGKKGYSKK